MYSGHIKEDVPNVDYRIRGKFFKGVVTELKEKTNLSD